MEHEAAGAARAPAASLCYLQTAVTLSQLVEQDCTPFQPHIALQYAQAPPNTSTTQPMAATKTASFSVRTVSLLWIESCGAS